MSTFSFLHAADLHLDTPFEGLSVDQPELARQLREASLVAFDRLVDAAIDRGAAFVVLAGDVYDGIERGLRAQFRLRHGLERLSEAGIPTFVAHGNHDPVGEGAGPEGAASGVHVFGPGEVRSIPVERGGARIATVHGISFSTREEKTNLARLFRRGPEPGVHVGVLHCNVDGQPGHDPYAPCSRADLEAAGLDYWALGHVHTRATLLDGRTWAQYPGNLQGRSFKPSEQGPKGAVLVHVEDDSVRGVEFLPLAPIVFSSVEVDVAGHTDLPSVQGALVDAALREAEVPGCEGLLLRARLTGRGPLHHELGRRWDELREALNEETASRTPWIRWERLTRDTRPEVNRDRIAERDDLAGEILRRIDALVRDPEAMKNLALEVDGKLRGPSLAKVVDPLGLEELEALLREVELDALERLEVEG
ncbi:MAG TPA: DNA repair exonuclease [Vulgatibacter sp.]|nr:DNA repair exonuclease [Vulgatibacter sp.]